MLAALCNIFAVAFISFWIENNFKDKEWRLVLVVFFDDVDQCDLWL
jgi:hypothetical protein